MSLIYIVIFTAIALYFIRKVYIRLQLSKAKHPSLRGHAKMSRRVSKLVPFFSYSEKQFFSCDSAPNDIAHKRQQAFNKIQQYFAENSPKSIAMSDQVEHSISDIDFTNAYRVPFPFRNHVRKNLRLGSFIEESSGTQVKDLDGNWSYDLTGSYGVNVFGYDFYKECIEKGVERVKSLGPVLGPYHPVIVDNVERLKAISGLDEVSFHMSGTEAVMQAVRLSRYHTGRSHLVRFCGAYHGWWDGVQPGVGNQRKTNDVYTLKDNDEDTLHILRTRKDIACVLINPLQALHLNSDASSDAMLINSARSADYKKDTYVNWLKQVREVCTERNIVLIFDEVFVGFRLAYAGAQEYYGIQADMVTYGKSLGGGLPVGVVCGKHHLMKRYKENKPTHICFARGTFNSHPYVMATMNEFLTRIDNDEVRATYKTSEDIWNKRVELLNQQLADKSCPVKIVNLMSICTITYTQVSRYNWMFQYYLRKHGLALSWIGTGRLIMSHNYTDEDFQQVVERFVKAAQEMQEDGWWWHNPELSNKSISKQFLRDMLKAKFGF